MPLTKGGTCLTMDLDPQAKNDAGTDLQTLEGYKAELALEERALEVRLQT